MLLEIKDFIFEDGYEQKLLNGSVLNADTLNTEITHEENKKSSHSNFFKADVT